MGVSNINKLLEEMTNKLISKGYITSTVVPDESSDLSEGELALKIVSGKIEGIQINSGNSLDKLKEFFMFKRNKGDVLNQQTLKRPYIGERFYQIIIAGKYRHNLR